MRVCKMFVRALVGLVIAGGMWGASANAQTVTVSPTDLSFGVPTGTPVASGQTFPQSAPQTVTVNIQGSGNVTFTPPFATGNPDFVVNGNSCTGMLAAPTTCQISVVYTASQAPNSTLENASLMITSNSPSGTLSVPMNGAYGAIEIFGALNINPSLFQGVTWTADNPTAGNPVSTNTIALSCPVPTPTAPIKAVLSSTPNGTGLVFQDNTMQFVTPSAPSNQTLNVCRGGDSNFQGFSGFPPNTTNCFQATYESAAKTYLGQNPDLATSGNSSFISTYGVPVIDVSSFLVAGTQKVTVELDDAGGDLGASTLHLVTNCSLAGTVPGGSITGNPINQNDPSTQTQTFTFDNGGGQNIGFTTSTSTAQQAGTVDIPPNTVPIITDIGIPQQLFSQLVAGKSSAPAVCLRLTGEIDDLGQPMCKGYLMQCQDPTNNTVSGDNCVPNPSSARNLLDIARFESPDAVPAQTNYLGPACVNATGVNCVSTTLTGSSPTLIGPGMLLGSDNWLCSGQTCPALDTATPTTPASYSAANCQLSGSLAGNICPLDTLTEFLGAADPVHGSTTSGKNSIFIPVVNMPLPYTTITQMTPAINGNGWVNTTSFAVNFTSNPANYPADTNPATTPPSNGFSPAPTYSLTWGVTPNSSQVPDTTYPVSGDTTYWNPGANQQFGQQFPKQPLCGSVSNPSFPSTVVPVTAPGIYNLHYFTTDCALTEELLFNPNSMQVKDPTANWASFRTIAFGVDTTAPVLNTCTLTPSAPAPNSHGWYTSSVSASCPATDELSGFGAEGATPPGPAANTNGAVIQGAGTGTKTGVSSGTGLTAQIPALTIQDLAGNTSNSQGPFATPTDSIAPTFSAKFNASGTTFNVGQSVMATFNCSDTGGSGLAICGTQTVSTCPVTNTVNAGVGLASFNTPVPVDTSAPGQHTVRAVDCAGNQSTGSVTYNVVYGSAELLIANVPNPLASVKSGSNLTYNIFVLNLSANTASNIVVTDTLPAGTQVVGTPIANIGSCTPAGCGQITSGSSCSVSGNVVSCSTPTLKPLLPGLTGFVIKLVVKVTEPSSVKSISDTATVTSANPDPIKLDNSVTVVTKVTQ